MKTAQTRQPFATPSVRPRPQLFCRDAQTGKLLWARDDGLSRHVFDTWRFPLVDSCGIVEQAGGRVSQLASSPGFVHEYNGLVLLVTSSGDLLTFDDQGSFRSVYRNALAQVSRSENTVSGDQVNLSQPFYSALAARGRTVWTQVENDLVAIDIENGVQARVPGATPFKNLIHPDGSIILKDESTGALSALAPGGNMKWGPMLFPELNHSGFFWGVFENGDLVTSAGIVSAENGQVIATWPEGTRNAPELDDYVMPQNETILTHLWHDEDGIEVLYYSVLDRELKVIEERKSPVKRSGFVTEGSVDKVWFLYDLKIQEGSIEFWPNSSNLIGSWLEDITLPEPVSIPLPSPLPTANKKRNPHFDLPDESKVLRTTDGGFFAGVSSNGPSGQQQWTIQISDGPQVGADFFTLSNDGKKIYYIG